MDAVRRNKTPGSEIKALDTNGTDSSMSIRVFETVPLLPDLAW